MFETRLNPIAPSAKSRLILERVGIACRKHSGGWDNRNDVTQFASSLVENKSLAIPLSVHLGGIGADSLVSAMAVERAGRLHVLAGIALGVHHASLQTINQSPRSGELVKTITESSAQRPTLVGSCTSGWSALTEDDSDHHGDNHSFESYLTDGTAPMILPLSENGFRQVALITSPKEARPPLDQRGRVFEPLVIDGKTLERSLKVSSRSDDTNGCELAYYQELNLQLHLAAAYLGGMAEHFESLLRLIREHHLNARMHESVVGLIGEIGSRLEASRGLVYAAATLKNDLDAHLDRKHLQLECGALIGEAYRETLFASSSQGERLVELSESLASAESERRGIKQSSPDLVTLIKFQTILSAARYEFRDLDAVRSRIGMYYITPSNSR